MQSDLNDLQKRVTLADQRYSEMCNVEGVDEVALEAARLEANRFYNELQRARSVAAGVPGHGYVPGSFRRVG